MISRAVFIPALMTSDGMPSLHGALPQATELIALHSSPRGWNVKLIHDRQEAGTLNCCVSDDVLPIVELLVMFCPSLHQFAPVFDDVASS